MIAGETAAGYDEIAEKAGQFAHREEAMRDPVRTAKSLFATHQISMGFHCLCG